MLINMSKKAIEDRIKELKNSTFIFNKEVEFKNSNTGQKQIFNIYIAASFYDLTIHYSDNSYNQDYRNIDDMVETDYLDNNNCVIVYSIVDKLGKTTTQEFINKIDVSLLVKQAKSYIDIVRQKYNYLMTL